MCKCHEKHQAMNSEPVTTDFHYVDCPMHQGWVMVRFEQRRQNEMINAYAIWSDYIKGE